MYKFKYEQRLCISIIGKRSNLSKTTFAWNAKQYKKKCCTCLGKKHLCSLVNSLKNEHWLWNIAKKKGQQVNFLPVA